jgi:hypothetical protein
MHLYRKCSYCQGKYANSRNVKHRHKDYCSFSCKENAIDADLMVNGVYHDLRTPIYAVNPQEKHDV